MSKQSLIEAANAELTRIGVNVTDMGGFMICENMHGVVSAGDESGYYPCKNHRTLVADLKEFADGSIEDQIYDGEQSHTWSDLWSLFDNA